jgi:toxin ParE1/3/4
MLIWTHRARADLRAIHDYIAKDSPQNAKRVAHEIRRKAEALAEPPRIGRKVPELNDPQLREISAFSWRILYHLREGNVFIVTLIHKRRQPAAEDLTPD